MNDKNITAIYGYIITRCGDPGTRCPIGAVSHDGDYQHAFADSVVGHDMAVYPTRGAAEAAVGRICARYNASPGVSDGLCA